MKIKITSKEIQDILEIPVETFPKYSTQLINLANQNAQGTRPKVVGQLSELIQEFSGKTLDEWKEWYLERHPESIKNATDKIYDMISSFKDVLTKIDKDLIERWVNDLVIIKTFIGLSLQEAILKKVSNLKNTNYRLATIEEESKGIDGYVNNIPVSIKPFSYNSKMALSENIDVKFIFYEKKKSDVIIEFDF